MGAPDDLSVQLDERALQRAIESGQPVEPAARALWRFAPSLYVWRTLGVLWDRSPWWYLREYGELYEARQALRWVRRGGHGQRTAAGWRLVEGVAAADHWYDVELKNRRGGG